MGIHKLGKTIIERFVKSAVSYGKSNVMCTKPIQASRGIKISMPQLTEDTVEISQCLRPISKGSFMAASKKGLAGKGSLVDLTTLLNQQTSNVRKAYEELQQVIIARNPEKNGSIDRLTLFANRILKNEHFIGKESELLRYIKDFKSLASMEDPQGAPLLGTNFINYMVDPVNMNPEKFKGLKDLIVAAKQGYIDKCMFHESNWYKYANGISSGITEDIRLLREAQAKGINPVDLFIPKMKKPTDWYYLTPGTIYQDLNGKCAVRCDGSQVVELNVGRETLYSLMPPIRRYFSAQNMSGTCYNLTAINGMLQSPKSRGYMLKNIYIENGKLMIKMPYGSTPKDNIFCGKFNDFHPQGRMQVELKNGIYKAIDDSQTVRSNPLIQALETLYGSHRKYTMADKYIKALRAQGKNWKSEYEYLLKNMDNTIIIEGKNGTFTRYTLNEFYDAQLKLFKLGKLNREPKLFKSASDYYKEGGRTREVYDFFMGHHSRFKSKTLKIPQNISSSELDKLRTCLEYENPTIYFSTLNKGSDSVMLNTEKSLACNHAYFIESYDRVTDMVTYINPWNSALTYKMPLKDLVKYIANIDLCYA